MSMHCPTLQEFVAMVTRYTRHLSVFRRLHTPEVDLSTAYIFRKVTIT